MSLQTRLHGLLRVSTGSSSPALETRKPGQRNTRKGLEPRWSYMTSAVERREPSLRVNGRLGHGTAHSGREMGKRVTGVGRALAGCRTAPPVETGTSRPPTSPASWRPLPSRSWSSHARFLWALDSPSPLTSEPSQPFPLCPANS